jgi:hypothetical protein
MASDKELENLTALLRGSLAINILFITQNSLNQILSKRSIGKHPARNNEAFA